MKKYDKIYVPHNRKEHGVWMDNNHYVIHDGFAGPDYRKEVVPIKSIIVLTIEELSEVFIAGQQYQSGIHPYSNIVSNLPDFKTYLQSKGINI